MAGRAAVPDLQPPGDLGYRDQLVERLEALGVEFLPWPSASHEEIVRRAAERRPPFDEAGSGYRDTLVWMSCLELAAGGEHVYLVTQDKDFAGRDGELAAQLQAEVAPRPGSVTLVRHLGSWLLPLVPWRDVVDLREAAANARDEEVASMFAPWDIFEDPDFTPDELGLPPGAVVEEVTYHGSSSYNLERVSHARADDGSYRITYTFPIEFEVLMTVPSDAARAEGYIDQEGHPSGRETIKTVVPMVGEMIVRHDETLPGEPFYYESFDFRPLDPSGLTGEPTGPVPGEDPLPFE